MFEVLVFVYENYWRGDACPEWEHLERKLNAVGFDADEIQEALTWLSGLSLAAQGSQLVGDPRLATAPDAGYDDATAAKAHGGGSSLLKLVANPSPAKAPAKATGALPMLAARSSDSMRVYAIAEQDHLGSECLGFITFLESAGVLPASMREIVVDRAMAAPGNPVSLDDLKIIILMVYWSLGEEPDALVLDELCDDATDRVAH
jgi:Smg protein